MTGLGVRSSSNGSLEKTGLNGVVLSIQTTRAKPSKMHKEREAGLLLPWICKLAGRKKVGMLLLFLISAVVFLRVLFVGKGNVFTLFMCMNITSYSSSSGKGHLGSNSNPGH